MNKFLWAGIITCFSIAQAFAADVEVTQAWARATAPGQDSAAVAMQITSAQDANIISVSSSASSSAEIHSMVHENGMMMMRALDLLPLKANQEVSLGTDGNHLMLIGLKKPLKQGDAVTLTITVEFADKHTEKVKVKALVKALTTGHDEHQHHH